jgi:hypothetical protein
MLNIFIHKPGKLKVNLNVVIILKITKRQFLIFKIIKKKKLK